MGTGLKKCIPITLSGQLVDSAISPIGSPEVLVAKIECEDEFFSISLNTSCFSFIISGTASITKSALDTASAISS